MRNEKLGGLAEEQAALHPARDARRERGAPEEVFAAVTAEVGRLLGTYLSGMAR